MYKIPKLFDDPKGMKVTLTFNSEEPVALTFDFEEPVSKSEAAESLNRMLGTDRIQPSWIQFAESNSKSDPNHINWSEISKAAKEGRLDDVLKSGDYIPLTLTNGEDIGLDVGRDKNGKTYFVFHHAMRNRYHMNPKPTNNGGWRDSDMRRYANEDVYNLLPDEIKNIIKPTTIVQVLDGERIETRDNLFCLSIRQVFGSKAWCKLEPEDTQIDIFRDPHTRIKYLAGSQSSSWWWLRSARDSNVIFYSVYSDGSGNYNVASNSGAVILGFCIE